jgi:hypothetical protein
MFFLYHSFGLFVGYQLVGMRVKINGDVESLQLCTWFAL